VCVLGISPSVPQVQRAEARAIANDFGFTLHEVDTNEVLDRQYQANPANRC
jgi:PP-loop superfamily ATP-utilizing enzyme